ncbi:MAG: 3-isopropylmalate dehydratase large subunit [Acidobacteriia bacterium]|nr:3-isopropylmalate dehydratase large subunit [Terriglobia bacterium]
MEPKTLFDKIWDSHIVVAEPDCPGVLYIDLHLIHEVTSPQAFQGLRARGLRVRRPDRTFATMDHIIPTVDQRSPIADPLAARLVTELEANCRDFAIRLFGIGDPHQGIVHVIGPELGLTQPGKTIVCGDSHTSTHGAFGALAFGIGTSEVEHVLATQCLLQRRPKTFEVRVEGRLQPGITAKDVILALIAGLGVAGGTGHVFEFTGSTIRASDIDDRLTICNMSIEGGARAGMVAPDDTTFQYLAGRPFAPAGAEWDAALARWRAMRTDDGAVFDKQLELQAASLEPMISYGTNPGMTVSISARVPDPEAIPDLSQRSALTKALHYMGLNPGRPLLGQPVDVVFIGSCTNARISDLRAAARILEGRKVNPRVKTVVVSGSRQVKAAAESEGLDKIFLAAGAEWREPGCSMCIAMNGDELAPGQYCVSTSNRNFEGRQGKGGRTLLASPLTAAASAVAGAIADVRLLM